MGQTPQDLGRYDENTRFTGLLQQKLGPEYVVIEEGLLGRTTCLDNPEMVGTNGLSYLIPCLGSHAPLDTLVIMLGTNDSRAVNKMQSAQIAANMERVDQGRPSPPRLGRRARRPSVGAPSHCPGLRIRAAVCGHGPRVR